MSLTHEQAAVIAEPNQSKLVCALPGSGKTHTTISLAENILKIPNSKTLMVTFTNAAASEMQSRIESRLGPAASNRVIAKTFAKVMLEQHKPIAAGRRLILGGELTSYVLRVFRKLKICISNLQYYQQVFDEFGRDLNWQPKPGNMICQAYIELQNLLAIYNRVDLNTVAKEVVYALQTKAIKPLNYTHYLLDEFQDTDAIQYNWLMAHKADNRYFTVVGDDDQSIYSWRGAIGYQNMIQFKKDFKAKAFLLSTCFRCSPLILGRAQHLIEHSDNRIQKDMKSSKTEKGSFTESIYRKEYISPFTKSLSMRDEMKSVSDSRKSELKNAEEYRFVVDQLQEDFHSWAVLCRTNVHLDNLERAFSERGIPAVRLGGKSIFDSPNVIAISKLLYGVTHHRSINEVIEGLGWLGECEQSLQSMLYTGRTHGFTALNDTKWLSITQQLQDLCSKISHSTQTEDGAIYTLNTFFAALRKHTSDSQFQDQKGREASIDLIERITLSMKGTLTKRAETLFDLACNSGKRKNQDTEGKIVLCTLTGSKGLEWPKVFIMNVNSDLIPSLKDEVDSESIEKKIEEERRLLYVGITRAEDECVIHYHEGKASMFIDELGPMLPFRLTIEEEIDD